MDTDVDEQFALITPVTQFCSRKNIWDESPKYLNVLEKYLKIKVLLQCTSTSTQDFSEMYLRTFQVLYNCVFKYKVLLPGTVKQCCHLTGGRHTKILDGPTCDYM